MADDCVFCKIARKEIPVEIVYENESFIAFLDAFPCARGQTLVIPKKHAGYFIELDDKTFTKLMLTAKKTAKAMQKSFNPIKVGVIIEGLEVQHVHVKLFPLSKGGFAELMRCKPKFSKENMKETAELLRTNLSST